MAGDAREFVLSLTDFDACDVCGKKPAIWFFPDSHMHRARFCGKCSRWVFALTLAADEPQPGGHHVPRAPRLDELDGDDLADD